MFPLRDTRDRDGNTVWRFFPYHKSVVDWLLLSEQDTCRGHRVIADRLLEVIGVKVHKEAVGGSMAVTIAPPGLFGLLDNDRAVVASTCLCTYWTTLTVALRVRRGVRYTAVLRSRC